MKSITTYVVYLLVGIITWVGNSQNKDIVIGNAQKTISPSNHRYAFIVGNDHYEDASITNLSSCRLDAFRMKHFMLGDSNWNFPKENIKLLLDVTKNDFRVAFEELLQRIKHPEVSTFYFYYSGHGVQGGIVPVDYDARSSENIISYDWIIRTLEKAKVNATVYILDACYSGSIIEYKNLSYDYEYWQALNTNKKQDNYVVLTATNAYRVTAAGKHESKYTKFLLNALEAHQTDIDKNGIIDSKELYLEIEEKLKASGVPQFFGNEDFPIATTNLYLKQNMTTPQQQTFSTELNLVDYSQIIAWRNAIENNKFSDAEISEMIQALKKDKSAISYSKLGFLYRLGKGVEQDYNKAISYFIVAMDKNDSFAKYNLGMLYLEGKGFSKDIKKALRYFKEAAKEGDPYAQYNLGISYINLDAKHLENDIEKAVFWLEKAAINDLDFAHFNLGRLYLNNAKHAKTQKTTAKWERKAFKCFVKAAAMNHSRAQAILANLYATGKGTTKNTLLSNEWLKRACQNNDFQSCKKLISIQESSLLTNN